MRGSRREDDLREQAEVGRLAGPLARALRNPTSALEAACEMLAEDAGTDQTSRGLARLIQYEGARIYRAMAEFVSLALPLELSPEFMDAVQFLREEVAVRKAGAAAEGVRISTALEEGPLDVWADREALRLLIDSLMRQALTAAGRGGRVAVGAERAAGAGGPAVRLAFSDTGPRVPDEVMGKVFEPYALLGDRSPGMSFALCRRVVEHLDGTVAIRNEQDAGVTVEIRLRSRDSEAS